MQHPEDHSVVPTGRRAINTANHRAQASLILASLGRSCLCHQSLRRNGLDDDESGEGEKRGKEKKRRDGEAKHRLGPQTLMLLREPLSRSQTVACPEVIAGVFEALQPPKTDCSGRVQ